MITYMVYIGGHFFFIAVQLVLYYICIFYVDQIEHCLIYKDAVVNYISTNHWIEYIVCMYRCSRITFYSLFNIIAKHAVMYVTI